MKREKMTLTSICSGAIQEKIDRALREVGNNILDPNTDPKKKRSITLQIIFTPNEDDREDVTVTAEVKKTLAPEAGVKTKFFIAKDIESGAMTIQEHQRGEIKGQLSFDDIEAAEEHEPASQESPEGKENYDAAVGGEVLDFRMKK